MIKGHHIVKKCHKTVNLCDKKSEHCEKCHKNGNLYPTDKTKS